MSEYVTNHDSLQVKERIAALGDDQLQDYHYLGVHVGKHAMDSCIKYFRQGLFDKDNPLHYKQLRNYVYQGAALVKVGEGLLKKEKPSHFFTLHGCYSSWGPIAEYLAAQGVRVYIYRKSINKVGDFDFIQYGEDANDILAKQVWEAAQYRPLDTDKKETLRLFLGKKRNGQTLDYKLYSLGKKEKKSDSLEKMIRSDHKKKYALYAHLLWDRGFNTLGGLFKDDIEWMFETIEYFINQKELFLIIKPHPAERSYFDWTEKGVKDVILKRYGALPDHIVILDNDYPLTSFDLMGAGFIGLVYNGTTGLEHSYFKKPALVAANIHYLSAGAALRINTREEYFRTIDDPSPLYAFVENNYDRIERYAYHYYYRQQIPIPFFRKDIFLGHCIDWDVLKDYKDFIEKDKIVNHIVTSILAGAPVVNPD